MTTPSMKKNAKVHLMRPWGAMWSTYCGLAKTDTLTTGVIKHATCKTCRSGYRKAHR